MAEGSYITPPESFRSGNNYYVMGYLNHLYWFKLLRVMPFLNAHDILFYEVLSFILLYIIKMYLNGFNYYLGAYLFSSIIILALIFEHQLFDPVLIFFPNDFVM